MNTLSATTTLCTLAASVLMTFTNAASAQSNVRDFGPPSYRGGVNAIPAYGSNYVRPNYAAAYAAHYAANVPTAPAYSSPHRQVGYRPNTLQTPLAGANCAYAATNPAYHPHAYHANGYGSYAAGYAPYTQANSGYWSSNTPRQYAGKTLFGTQTIYGKDQPFLNIGRFFIP